MAGSTENIIADYLRAGMSGSVDPLLERLRVIDSRVVPSSVAAKVDGEGGAFKGRAETDHMVSAGNDTRPSDQARQVGCGAHLEPAIAAPFEGLGVPAPETLLGGFVDMS